MRRAVERAAAAAAARRGGAARRERLAQRRATRPRLYDEAVQKYGSEAGGAAVGAAARARASTCGAAPSTSRRGEGAAWLEEHGVRFGLCRRYDNEPWHFERLAAAKGSTCPAREPHA